MGVSVKFQLGMGLDSARLICFGNKFVGVVFRKTQLGVGLVFLDRLDQVGQIVVGAFLDGVGLVSYWHRLI